MQNIKLLSVMLLPLVGIFIIDQNIKSIFLDGYRYYGDCIDLTLVFNKGVAFSMLSFLEDKLKYIQLVLVVGVAAYIFLLKNLCYGFGGGLLLGGAFSNIYDRFIHGGVVDMVYWHCWFDFAVFNFADVVIDIAVGIFLLLQLRPSLCKAN